MPSPWPLTHLSQSRSKRQRLWWRRKCQKAHNNTALDCPKGRYIAYFQSYTNTYAPVSRLRALFTEAIAHPDIAILSIATRPDCLPPEIIALLSELNRIKPVWVELGLQTIHEETARFIRRGYPLSVFEDAWNRLHGAGLTVIAHVILGLPGETRSMMQDTVSYLGGLGTHGIDGVKLQLLHVLRELTWQSCIAPVDFKPFPWRNTWIL